MAETWRDGRRHRARDIRRHEPTHTKALTLLAAAVTASVAAYAFSRFTGWISESVTLPVGAMSLATGLLLTILVPYSVGLRWGATGYLAGWVRVRTENLVGPTVMHATKNVIAVARDRPTD